MALRIEWDVPYAGETVSFGHLASFVERAASCGAGDDTALFVVPVDRDDSIISAFRVDIEVDTEPRGRSLLIGLDRSDVVDAVAVLEAIEDNEGDARMQLAAVRELRQKLTKLAME